MSVISRKTLFIVMIAAVVLAASLSFTACNDDDPSSFAPDPASGWELERFTAASDGAEKIYYVRTAENLKENYPDKPDMWLYYDGMEVSAHMADVSFSGNAVFIDLIDGREIYGEWKATGESGSIVMMRFTFGDVTTTGTYARVQNADGSLSAQLELTCPVTLKTSSATATVTFRFTASA